MQKFLFPGLKTALLAAVCCVPALAHADDVTRRAKAEEMMKLTKTDTALQDQLGALQERVQTMAQQQSAIATPNPAQKTLTDDYLKQVKGVTDEEVGWATLRPKLVQSYADTFTEAELDAIIAFYKTPAGQTLVTKTPELSTKTVGLVQERIKEMQPKLAAMTDTYVTKMKAADTPAPSLNAPAAKSPAAAPAH